MSINDKTQSRKWQLTINNPIDYGFSHEKIKSVMQETKAVYWCMADEIGECGTPHTHIYICFGSGVRFSTLKKRFPTAHIEFVKGTSQENMEYVSKTGKWEKDKKKETCVDGTFEEFGEMPVERQGKRNDIDDLYDMIKSGMTDFEILESSPDYLLHLDKIEKARQTIRNEQYADTFRKVDVTYIWGDTGSGKTRGVMEKYGYRNVFRVTDYKNPFDNYRGQDVVIFEEFRSSFHISQILNLLDGYPLELACRYANKYACYTKVYLITNIPISQQYKNLQLSEAESYNGFLRRINRIHHYINGRIEESHIEITANGFRTLFDGEVTPFDINKGGEADVT